MKNLGTQYEVRELIDESIILNYIFLSKSSDDEVTVVKLIQYAPFLQPNGQPTFFDGKLIYNMGFGDYDPVTKRTNDATLTGNKDTYKVFNTVLGTVPMFFEKNPAIGVMVQGSDSKPEFEEECKKSCPKKCLDGCRKINQRINIYCKYVSKNLETLSFDYQFVGGIKNHLEWFDFENFIPYKEYDTVIVYKK